MDRQSRGWRIEFPLQPSNFWILKEFVLISSIKPGVRKALNTLVHQRTSSINAFNISGRISSSPAVFLDFNPCIAAGTSVNVKTSFFPKSFVSHVSVGVTLTGFNKSSKYSLQRERTSFLSLRMFPFESLMEVAVLKLFPRKRRKVCQNTSFVDE